MKKTISRILLISVLTLCTATSFAGRYNSLKFISDRGETYTVTTNNLEIFINGENISFSNTDLILPLSSLVTMEFTDYDDSPAEINAIMFERNGVVMIYNLNGMAIGSFESYSEAFGSLNNGIYVIKDVRGNSLKVKIEK